VTAAVAYICYSFPPAQRSMSKLLEIIHGGSALDAMIVGLRTAVNIRAMVMAGTSLAEMNEKTAAMSWQRCRPASTAGAMRRSSR